MRGGIHHIVVLPIPRLRSQVGRGIAHQPLTFRHNFERKLLEFKTLPRVRGCVVAIHSVTLKIPILGVWHPKIQVFGIFAHLVHVAIHPSFIPCLLRPMSASDIIRGLVMRGVPPPRLAQQVHRHSCELQSGPAIEKMDLKIIGNLLEASKLLLRISHYFSEIIGPVPHLQNAYTASRPIHELLLRAFKNLQRQRSISSRKIHRSTGTVPRPQPPACLCKCIRPLGSTRCCSRDTNGHV
mmetsp:Transcript_22380/g.48861  ORF Transcript_22380/g.48861 Transcript_22380/m.48861 type:complete len:239 (-) Transcript_22380:27-743(-)